MSNEEFYKQCRLYQEVGGSRTETVTWIPEKNLEVGSTLRLQDPITNEFMDGRWTVASIGDEKKTKSQVKERIRIGRKYMKSTDV